VFYSQATDLVDPNDPDKQWFAQVDQDKIVTKLLSSMDNADSTAESSFYFVDLASNEARVFSNTLGLEKRGWNGLFIEPNARYWYGLSQRKCTTIGALVGGEVVQVDVKLWGVYGGIIGKISEPDAETMKGVDGELEKRYTIPFPSLLAKFGAPKTIDYLSLDVEGAEYLVMHSFPFSEYTIRILTIERPSQELKDLLERSGYLFLSDISSWGETLWAHKSTGFSPVHPKVVAL
jgi:hypothetical protein